MTLSYLILQEMQKALRVTPNFLEGVEAGVGLRPPAF